MVDEQTGEVVACELTSKSARDFSRVASLVRQLDRPISSARTVVAYDTAAGEITAFIAVVHQGLGEREG